MKNDIKFSMKYLRVNYVAFNGQIFQNECKEIVSYKLVSFCLGFFLIKKKKSFHAAPEFGASKFLK